MSETASKVARARRRKPPTERGERVINAVTATAHRLLQDHFVDQLSLVELAKESGVARASLLLQFPGGWPDVLATVAIQEINLDSAFEQTRAAPRLTRAKRVFMALNTLLDRAEETGRLYPNLRAGTFSWGSEIQSVFRIAYEGCWENIMDLATDGGRLKADQRRRTGYLVENLLNLTLDLASSEGYLVRTWDERRDALRLAINATLVAIGDASSD
jgi:AcrR family transcriptional regulator